MLSNDIRKYIEKVNLIDKDLFCDDCLEPASYDFRLGEEYYYVEDPSKRKYFKLSKDNPVLEIPPNAIVFVSTYETVNIPRYMIARFNVLVHLVYKGLLLGTGPQVDPGFSGRLFCPLHNLSTRPIYLDYKEKFATIDFIKTTSFLSEEERDEIERLSETAKLQKNEITIRDNTYKLFSPEKLKRESLKDYLPAGDEVRSSVDDLNKEVRDLRNTVDKYRRIAYGVIIVASISLAVLLSNAFFHFSNRIDKSMEVSYESINKVEELENKISTIKSNLDLINTKIEN